MATQVETVLPSNNPLMQQEGHGHASNATHEVGKEEKQPTGGTESDAKDYDERGGYASNNEQSKEQVNEGGDDPEQRTAERESSRLKETETPGGEGGEKGSKKEFTEAPLPKVNPWTKKMNSVTVISVNGQAHPDQPAPAKVVKAGNPRPRKGSKVSDFGDAMSWPTPGEMVNKEVQAPVGKPQPPKKTAVKEKRDSEESKENQKTRSDDSGEEKNGDEDSQKYGSRKKGNKHRWVPLPIEVKSEGPKERSASRNNTRQNEHYRLPPNSRNDLRDWHSANRYERDWREDHDEVSSVKSEEIGRAHV